MFQKTKSQCGNFVFWHNKSEELGDVCYGHAHDWDHPTFVRIGRIKVVVTRPDFSMETFELGIGEYALIRAQDCHEITALEAVTEFICLWVPRLPTGEATPDFTGWAGGHP